VRTARDCLYSGDEVRTVRDCLYSGVKNPVRAQGRADAPPWDPCSIQLRSPVTGLHCEGCGSDARPSKQSRMVGSTLGLYNFGLIFVSARTNKSHHHHRG
jgi:hypothetical protein